jgi:hypothetical protein
LLAVIHRPQLALHIGPISLKLRPNPLPEGTDEAAKHTSSPANTFIGRYVPSFCWTFTHSCRPPKRGSEGLNFGRLTNDRVPRAAFLCKAFLCGKADPHGGLKQMLDCTLTLPANISSYGHYTLLARSLVLTYSQRALCSPSPQGSPSYKSLIPSNILDLDVRSAITYTVTCNSASTPHACIFISHLHINSETATPPLRRTDAADISRRRSRS